MVEKDPSGVSHKVSYEDKQLTIFLIIYYMFNYFLSDKAMNIFFLNSWLVITHVWGEGGTLSGNKKILLRRRRLAFFFF